LSFSGATILHKGHEPQAGSLRPRRHASLPYPA
jgi:hypothetical protein